MQYRYKKIITSGAFGSTIMHRNNDNVFTLGDIGEYTYIFADNLNDQPQQLEFKEAEYKEIKLLLDKNNRFLNNFKDDINFNKSFKALEIKSSCTANNPVTLDVDFIDGTIKTITFNGGDSSASAIASAVELAQNLNETNVSLWDYDNIIHHNISFAEAMTISAFIAKKYRDDMFKRQDLLKQINDATTIEELGAIQWI